MRNKPSLTAIRFGIGDTARLTGAIGIPEYKNAVGKVVGIIPDDRNSDEFTMYDIEFPFGLHTLYGSQIEPE